MHLARLDADPPPLLPLDFLSDEGYWAHNARDHALFGRWILDDHNLALYGAPLWTATLRGAYALLGVGLWQTRLPSALAGLATCALLFVFVRRAAGTRAGLAAALLLGLDPFSLVHHRSAFVESFAVAWLTAAFVVLERARGRAGPAAAAGALFAGAVLAKIWAVGGLAVVVLFWALRAAAGRSERPGLSLREPLAFAAGGAAVALVVGVLFVLPHLEAVRAGVGLHAHRGSFASPLHSLGALGLAITDRGPVASNGLLHGSTALVLAVAVVLARACVVPSPWLREPPLLLCLSWIAGVVLQVGSEGYQPDRRWMALPPAAVALVSIAWARGGLALPTRAQWRAASPVRRLAALGVAAALAGVSIRGVLVQPLADAVPLLADRTHAHLALAGGLAWALCALLVFAALAALTRWLPARPRAGAVAAVLAALFAVRAGATAWAIARAPSTVRDTSRALAAATRGWPAADRRMLGDAADTLALETDLFAFVSWSRPGRKVDINPDGWERFDPTIVVGSEPERPGFTRLPDLEIARAADGGPRTSVRLWVRDDRADAVAAALRARAGRLGR